MFETKIFYYHQVLTKICMQLRVYVSTSTINFQLHEVCYYTYVRIYIMYSDPMLLTYSTYIRMYIHYTCTYI